MPIKHKRSAIANKVPTAADLELGELAINTRDGKLYLKKDDGTVTIVEVGAVPDGAITSSKIADGTIATTDLATQTITDIRSGVDLGSRVAKFGDTMTGTLTAPTLVSTGSVRSGATGDNARATGFKIADGTDVGELNRNNQYYDDRANNCSGYLPTGNCLGNPQWSPPNGNWWTWGLGFTPGNPGYDFAGGSSISYQAVSVGFVYGAYALAADEIGGAEYRRSYNNCNCGAFNCYSNCNCNCDCNCNCNC